MVMKVTVEGTLGKDCPHMADIEKLRESMVQTVKRKLELRPEDEVEIIFRQDFKCGCRQSMGHWFLCRIYELIQAY